MARGASSDDYGSFGSVPDSVRVDGSGAQPSGVRASPEDFGAAIGSGLSKLGATGEEIANHYQEMAVHTATNDAYVNGYAPAVNNLVSNYKKLSGTDALQQLPDYQKQLQELNQQYLNTGSPRQRELMGGLVARHTISTMDNMSNHADQQYAQHEQTVNRQSVQNASDEAANNYNNPDVVDFNVNRAKGLSTLYYGSHIGHDADSQPIVDQMSKEEGSKVVKSAIDTALDNGDFQTANFYKNKYADTLSGKDKLSVEKSVSSLNISNNARNYVDNLLTGSPAVTPGTPHYDDLQKKATVANIAQKENFDPNIAFALHGTESDYGRGIKPDSARKDDFQTDKSLRDKGYEGDDLASSAHNAFKIWNENSADLTKRTGQPATPALGYLAYNQGGQGAATLLAAGPNDTAVQALSKIMSPQDALAHVTKNGGTPTMAASDFVSHVQDVFMTHYDAQKVSVADGDVAGAITKQAGVQLPAMQQASNPHEYFNQISDRLPATQAVVDAIPDDKVREASQKQLKLKYEQAKLGDSAWKNGQAQTAQKYIDDPRYTSLDEIPQTVKNSLRDAGTPGTNGLLTGLEKAFKDKLNTNKDPTNYGEGFLPTLNRLSTDDPTDRISDLAGLQQEYGERQDLHSGGFNRLAGLMKDAGTPEGKAKLASQTQFLNDLQRQMVAGPNDAEGKTNFEKALPLFFNNPATNPWEMSMDPDNKNSFVARNGIQLPTSAQMTSKKIDASIQTISALFGNNRGAAVNARTAIAPAEALTPAEQVVDRFNKGKMTRAEAETQFAKLGVKSALQIPRPE